jgi:hypothetical protein
MHSPREWRCSPRSRRPFAGQFVIHYHPLANGDGGMTEVER